MVYFLFFIFIKLNHIIYIKKTCYVFFLSKSEQKLYNYYYSIRRAKNKKQPKTLSNLNPLYFSAMWTINRHHFRLQGSIVRAFHIFKIFLTSKCLQVHHLLFVKEGNYSSMIIVTPRTDETITNPRFFILM